MRLNQFFSNGQNIFQKREREMRLILYGVFVCLFLLDRGANKPKRQNMSKRKQPSSLSNAKPKQPKKSKPSDDGKSDSSTSNQDEKDGWVVELTTTFRQKKEDPLTKTTSTRVFKKLKNAEEYLRQNLVDYMNVMDTFIYDDEDDEEEEELRGGWEDCSLSTLQDEALELHDHTLGEAAPKLHWTLEGFTFSDRSNNQTSSSKKKNQVSQNRKQQNFDESAQSSASDEDE
jgi:hypothetical protein